MHDRVLKYLRITGDGEAAPQVRALWDEAQGLITPAAWQGRLDAEEFRRRFHPHATASLALSRLLAGCLEVVLLMVTLGDALEKRAKLHLAQGEAFRGYILDRLGSYLVEDRMRQLDRHVSREAQARGLAATRRFSPGYGDFSLEAQGVFLEMASGSLPGLRLSPGGLLQPEKTITALKGLHHPRPGKAAAAHPESA